MSREDLLGYGLACDRPHPSFVVTTFAGSPLAYGRLDGTGSAALFQGPQGLAFYLGHVDRKTVQRAGAVTKSLGTMGAGVGLAVADGLGATATDGAGVRSAKGEQPPRTSPTRRTARPRCRRATCVRSVMRARGYSTLFRASFDDPG